MKTKASTEAINEAEANKEKQKTIEEVKEEMCDHYCRFPNVAPNEWELWQICASCPMDRL